MKNEFPQHLNNKNIVRFAKVFYSPLHSPATKNGNCLSAEKSGCHSSNSSLIWHKAGTQAQKLSPWAHLLTLIKSNEQIKKIFVA